MINHHLRATGIVIRTIPFQDLHQIISLYSAEWGLMRIIIKYAYAKKSPCFVEPLNLVEICFKESKSDLYQSLSVSRLHTYHDLRISYAKLHAGLNLASSILKSQMSRKPSPILFSLLLRYLEYMPKSQFPSSLNASFKLKILRHDGWIDWGGQCAICQTALKELAISDNQLVCKEHLTAYAITFSQQESVLLKELSCGRSLPQIDQLCTLELEGKIDSLFSKLIN